MENVINKIICADVLDGLKSIPDNMVTLAVNSPPYNVNATKKWAYASADDDLPYQEYIKWLENVYQECYRVLRKGGRLIINIDAMTNRQEDKDEEYFRDIRTDLANRLKPMGFKFFGEHVWYKSTVAGGGNFCGKKTSWGSYISPSTPAVRRNHEYILVYSKDSGIPGAAFTLIKDVNSQPPDIYKAEFESWIASVWFINPETRNLGDHPVPFPEELVRRIIKLYSYPGDLILDPFNGVGTTTYIAAMTKRRYIGIDLDKAYCEYAENRIAARGNMFMEENIPDKKSKRQIEKERREQIEAQEIL